MALFTHVVPLGGNCRLTFNVRRHFGHAEGYPFDWWIAPLPGLVAALEARLDPGLLLDSAHLERAFDAGGRYLHVRHRALGLRYVHDFRGMPGEAGAPVDWEAHLRRPRGRLDHLRAKLLGLNAPGNAILFVRYCLSPTPEIAADTAEDLRRLRGILMELFDRAALSLLLLGSATHGAGTPTLPLDDPSPEWTGDLALWTRVLASSGHALRNPSLAPFSLPIPDVEAAAAIPAPIPAPNTPRPAGRPSGLLRGVVRRLVR